METLSALDNVCILFYFDAQKATQGCGSDADCLITDSTRGIAYWPVQSVYKSSTERCCVCVNEH